MHHHNGLKGDVFFLGYSLSIWYHLTGWRGFWEGQNLELFLTGVGGREQRQKTLEALGPVWLVAGAMGSKGTEEL